MLLLALGISLLMCSLVRCGVELSNVVTQDECRFEQILHVLEQRLESIEEKIEEKLAPGPADDQLAEESRECPDMAPKFLSKTCWQSRDCGDDPCPDGYRQASWTDADAWDAVVQYASQFVREKEYVEFYLRGKTYKPTHSEVRQQDLARNGHRCIIISNWDFRPRPQFRTSAKPCGEGFERRPFLCQKV